MYQQNKTAYEFVNKNDGVAVMTHTSTHCRWDDKAPPTPQRVPIPESAYYAFVRKYQGCEAASNVFLYIRERDSHVLKEERTCTLQTALADFHLPYVEEREHLKNAYCCSEENLNYLAAEFNTWYECNEQNCYAVLCLETKHTNDIFAEYMFHNTLKIIVDFYNEVEKFERLEN